MNKTEGARDLDSSPPGDFFFKEQGSVFPYSSGVCWPQPKTLNQRLGFTRGPFLVVVVKSEDLGHQGMESLRWICLMDRCM